MLFAACATKAPDNRPDAAATIDAPSGAVCGDGICAPSETTTCPADCGNPIDAAIDAPGDAGSGAGTCNNNGTCEPNLGESNTSCPSDCTYVCGNGICETGEDASSCPADCGPAPFDCAGSASPAECDACLTNDLLHGPGYCDTNHQISGGTAADCVACVGSGAFDASCASMCNSGYETEACSSCVAELTSCGNGTCEEALGETLDTCPADCTFSCTNATDATNCIRCLGEDWSYYETSPTGTCSSDSSVYPGDGTLCAACVATGYTTAGSACGAYCGSGETSDCAQCVAAQTYCGDGYCDTYEGENHFFCPSDCNAVCGDGICQTGQGETLDNCPADCAATCDTARTELQCRSCFEYDFMYGLGECMYYVSAPLTADECAACVSSGDFGSANPCEAACGSGETAGCAECMHNINTGLFDCESPYTVYACQTCFNDDREDGPGTCDTNFDAYPGSESACMTCVLDGSFGSGCAAACSGGAETSTCLECIENAQYCGDGTCETYDGESPVTCPQDCTAVCGDGICDTSEGETVSECPADCTPKCTDPSVEIQCEACFEEDVSFFGDCSSELALPLTPDACAACVGSGAFGSANPCESACSAGETTSCAHCMHATGPSTFDCENPYTVAGCQQCLTDDLNDGPGACDALVDAYPGSAADCLACAAGGTFGTTCETDCGSGETSLCQQCVEVARYCGDGTCEPYDGENPLVCPADCSATCGDGTCDTSEGESPSECPTDCPPAPGETCALAIPLTLDTTTSGTTAGAYSDYGATTVACLSPDTASLPGPDVAYSVTLTAGTSYTATASGFYDIAVSIVGPGDASVCTPGESSCVKGGFNYGSTVTAVYTPTTTGTYYIIVDGEYSGASGAFTVSVDD